METNAGMHILWRQVITYLLTYLLLADSVSIRSHGTDVAVDTDITSIDIVTTWNFSIVQNC